MLMMVVFGSQRGFYSPPHYYINFSTKEKNHYFYCRQCLNYLKMITKTIRHKE
jgi:hypothetical protein